MGLISGALSCTRFNIISLPEKLDFGLVPFHPILPGSTVREREGFVPFEPEEPYEFGTRQWAFRVRIDKVVLDGTQVSERLKELVRIEMENAGPPSPKMRRKLRLLAEDELMQHPMPRSKIIECLLTETTLYVGSTSKGHLGVVLELLKRIGVEVTFKTPWLDAGQEEEYFSEVVDLKEPGQSMWGCRFLKKLLADPETVVEPEKGSIRLVTADGVGVSLAGPVNNELDRFLEQGAEILRARILMEAFQFGFDALSFRLNGLKLDNLPSRHWAEQLDTRLDQLKQVWDLLDRKYDQLILTAEP